MRILHVSAAMLLVLGLGLAGCDYSAKPAAKPVATGPNQVALQVPGMT